MAYPYNNGFGQYQMPSQYQIPQQQMQQAMPQMVQQMPQNQQSADFGYVCRPVTSREEALATQVSFMGMGTVMPDLAHGKMWLKRFNQSTGACDLLEFCMSGGQEPTDEMQMIRKEIEELRKKIAKLEGTKDE